MLGFVEAGHSWVAESLVLFLVPFLHEDVAIIGGGLMVVEHALPIPLALVSLYAGMVSSDLALFGLGVMAREVRWIRRALLRPRIERLGRWVHRHVASVVILARFVPGLMFPVYLSCGLYRVPFPRFCVTTMLTAAVYLPVVFFVVASLGETVLTDIGYWSWFAAIALLSVAAVNWVRSPNWQLLFRVSLSGAGTLLKRARAIQAAPGLITHRGMPAIGLLPRRVARAERVPPLLFYIPLALQWVWLGLRYGDLSLPALANPGVEVGGLWGESKSAYLTMIGHQQRRWIADFATVRRGDGSDSLEADCVRARKAIAAAGLSFPLVAKPDIGWRGYGVRLVADEAELAAYIEAFPECQTVILQRAVAYDGEAGVLYARRPDEAEGRILSLTLRYFPHVVGDGRTSLRELIIDDQRAAWKAGSHLGMDPKHLGLAANDLDRVPAEGETVRLSFIGSNRVGGLYRDARQHITPALVRRFDEISKSMPDFYYGRYDIRFASLERLREGEDLFVIEINGAGGESINVWDPQMPMGQVYRELFEQQRLLFEIGALNRARGKKPVGAFAVLRSQWRQYRLILQYPPSG